MIERPLRLVLLGHPVAHSLSPVFQNAALVAGGIPLRYEALDVAPEQLPEALAALVREPAAGNVTVPHKTAVAAACGALRPAAEETGAVNTFWIENGVLVGDNTDVDGFDAMVRALCGKTPRNAVVGLLGAGGGAAAVLAAVARWEGGTALVCNRSPERATALCARFRSIAHTIDAAGLAANADLVVNATTIGLRDDRLPIDPQLLKPSAVLLDLVYRRRGETPWVRAGRASGRPAMDGLTMLVEQGAHAFERWFGVAPDREAMWRAVRP